MFKLKTLLLMIMIGLNSIVMSCPNQKHDLPDHQTDLCLTMENTRLAAKGSIRNDKSDTIRRLIEKTPPLLPAVNICESTITIHKAQSTQTVSYEAFMKSLSDHQNIIDSIISSEYVRREYLYRSTGWELRIFRVYARTGTEKEKLQWNIWRSQFSDAIQKELGCEPKTFFTLALTKKHLCSIYEWQDLQQILKGFSCWISSEKCPLIFLNETINGESIFYGQDIIPAITTITLKSGFPYNAQPQYNWLSTVDLISYDTEKQKIIINKPIDSCNETELSNLQAFIHAFAHKRCWSLSTSLCRWYIGDDVSPSWFFGTITDLLCAIDICRNILPNKEASVCTQLIQKYIPFLKRNITDRTLAIHRYHQDLSISCGIPHNN